MDLSYSHPTNCSPALYSRFILSRFCFTLPYLHQWTELNWFALSFFRQREWENLYVRRQCLNDFPFQLTDRIRLIRLAHWWAAMTTITSKLREISMTIEKEHRSISSEEWRQDRDHLWSGTTNEICLIDILCIANDRKEEKDDFHLSFSFNQTNGGEQYVITTRERERERTTTTTRLSKKNIESCYLICSSSEEEITVRNAVDRRPWWG